MRSTWCGSSVSHRPNLVAAADATNVSSPPNSDGRSRRDARDLGRIDRGPPPAVAGIAPSCRSSAATASAGRCVASVVDDAVVSAEASASSTARPIPLDAPVTRAIVAAFSHRPARAGRAMLPPRMPSVVVGDRGRGQRTAATSSPGDAVGQSEANTTRSTPCRDISVDTRSVAAVSERWWPRRVELAAGADDVLLGFVEPVVATEVAGDDLQAREASEDLSPTIAGVHVLPSPPPPAPTWTMTGNSPSSAPSTSQSLGRRAGNRWKTGCSFTPARRAARRWPGSPPGSRSGWIVPKGMK